MLLLAREKKIEIHTASNLAEKLCISESYLQQISKHLCTSGLLDSYRGPNGGYSLAKPVENISIGEVLRAMKHSSPDSSKSFSRENALQDVLFKGLINHLDSISIKSIVPNKKLIFPQQLSQRDNAYFMQKLII